jgi:hypothetical protein
MKRGEPGAIGERRRIGRGRVCLFLFFEFVYANPNDSRVGETESRWEMEGAEGTGIGWPGRRRICEEREIRGHMGAS